MEARTSLVWRSTQEKIKNTESIKEQKLEYDDDPNPGKETVLFEPGCTSSMLAATDLGMRMSRMGESRRRTKRMPLDMVSSSGSPYVAPSENYLDGAQKVRKLSSVSQHFLLDAPRAVVDAPLRSKSFSGSKPHHNVLQWSKSTWWGAEEDAGAAGPNSPSHYDMLEIGISQDLFHEATTAANGFRYSKHDSSQQVRHNRQLPITLHEDDIFPGNTKHLSRLRVKSPASELEDHAPAKRSNSADLQQPHQERSKLRIFGRSFSRHDTRSMKKLPNAPSSLPASPRGNRNNRESHTAQIFQKLLRGSSRVSSEVSTRREMRSGWEPETEGALRKKQVSNTGVVWEKCSLPRRPIQGRQKAQQAPTIATSETRNSWWPLKFKGMSKELRPSKKSLNKSLVVSGPNENKVDITADHHQDIYHDASSDMLDSSSISPNTSARFTRAFSIKERASRHQESLSWVWGTSPFAPSQPANPTQDGEKYLLPPRRLHK